MRRTYPQLPLSSSALARIDGVARALAGKHGPQQLADAVIALSRVYTRERAQLGQLDASSVLARAGFFFARDLVKPFGPLDELRAAGIFPASSALRVLDLGAGMGATSFGLARWLRLRALPVKQLTVTALERDAGALRGFQAFTRALSELPDEFAPLQLEARAEDVRALRGEREFSLVLMGFVLNELFPELPLAERIARRAELVQNALELLRDDGALVILEPALKDTTRELMQLRDTLASQSVHIIAPCLHAAACPMLPSARDWCHQELAYALPPALAEVARAAALRFEGLSYASLVLAKRPRPAAHDGLYRVVSDRLESKGKLELYGCGTHAGESEYVRFTQLHRKASAANAAFTHAQRGHILDIQPPADADTPRLRINENVTVKRH